MVKKYEAKLQALSGMGKMVLGLGKILAHADL
jgi:hypothetical protein